MQPSSILCRTQESRQRARANATTLENVKRIANAAATAWAKEGADAEKREDRKLRARAFPEAHSADDDDDEPPSIDARELSENPDRGHASIVEYSRKIYNK